MRFSANHLPPAIQSIVLRLTRQRQDFQPSLLPNAKYLVRDGLVFVFDKLVQLVKERQSDQSDTPVAELACNLVDEATVSAKEAVEAWGVVPVPYEMITVAGSITYEPGFEPVSEVMFNRVKELEADWRDDIARAATHAQHRVEDMWAQTADLRIGTLNDPSDEVPEYGLEDFAELRSYYPELSMLSDGSLYSLFDVFQMECRFINGWSPNRDNDFLFYLLGKVVDRENDHESAKDVGEWVADALLHGDTLDAALGFGRDATRYNQAIGKLAHRVASAMRFLAEDKKATDLRGHAITTMGDAFRIGRKFNATVMVAEQKLPL